MKRHEDEESETALYGSGGEPTQPVGEVRFDYAAFEQTMDQALPGEPPIVRTPSADVVQQRKTVDLQSFPKDDAVHDIRQLGKYQVVTIRGQINESFAGRAIGSALHGPTVFDLTEVDRVTSFGVRSWLEMMDIARLPFAVFVRASPAIVNQITMMRNFCGAARIQSLVVPYACARCGAAFGVPFDALEDRPVLRSRTPPKVACPECRGPSDMDEDPWIYFDIDDHLLESVDPDLQRLLAALGDGPRRPPVEKSISGDLTRVRINGPVHANTRLQRAFTGLEGKVVLDLRSVSEFDPAGLEHLLQCLTRLPDEVSRLSVEGAPLSLVRALVEIRPARVWVNSVVTTVRSLARPLRRRMCLDLKRHRAALKDLRVPELDLPWRGDPVQLEGQELLAEALSLLPASGSATGSHASLSGTLSFSSGGPTGASSTPAPLNRSAPSVPPLSVATLSQTPPPAPRAVPTPPPRRTNRLWIGLALSLAVGLALVTAIGAVVVFSVVQTGLAPPAGEGWSTGGPLAPAWTELEVAEADGALLVVGHGRAPEAEQALEQSRIDALDALLVVVAREWRTTFDDEALPPDGPERESAVARWRESSAALVLTRTQDSARVTPEGDTEVFAQYSLTRADLAAFADGYARQASFRGLTVAPRAPWMPRGLRLVHRESYLRSVEPGDLLVSVGGAPVAELDRFEPVAVEAYEALPEGESLSFGFERDGEAVETSVFKPKTRQEPPPSQVNRPTLFRKD